MRAAATLLTIWLSLLIGCAAEHHPEHPQQQQQQQQQPEAPDSVGAAPPARRTAPAATAGTVLIVHDAALGRAADTWSHYRRSTGWATRLLPVGPAATPQTVREQIDAGYATRPLDPCVVLLLGDADAIPPWRHPQPDPLLQGDGDWFISDHGYQRPEGNGPTLALGRIPARSSAEALTVLDKIRRYEQRSPGVWRRRVTCVAGEGRFGGLDLLLEMLFLNLVEQTVPQSFDFSMTYAKAGSIYCPPADRLTDVVLERLGEGALLFNYVGHGHAEHLDQLSLGARSVPMLDVTDLARLPAEHDQLPIALMTCCSAGWFDRPAARRCLGETMLLHPGGPVAVIAGSRITHPYANTILQKDVYHLLLEQRLETVGGLDLAADRSMLEIDPVDRQLDAMARLVASAGDWTSSLGELRSMHVRLYNLLGDPCTRIAHPDHPIGPISLEGDRIVGYADGVIDGRVVVTVETALAAFADGEPLVPARADDPAFNAQAAETYRRANERVLIRVDGAVRNGRFDVRLPAELPDDATVVKAIVTGADRDGRVITVFGALPISGTPRTPR